jgi:hypothetical protein
LLARLAVRSQRVDSFGGEARLRYYLGNGDVVGRQVRVIAQRGVGFRLWTLEGDQVVDDFVCARGELRYFSHRAGCHMRGRCNREEIYRALWLWIEPDDLVRLMNADAFVVSHSGASVRQVKGNGRPTRDLSLWGPRHRQDIRVSENGDDLFVLSTVTRRASTIEQVAYTHFSRPSEGSVRVPYSVKLVPGGNRPSVVVKWESIQLDIGQRPGSFELAPPASAPACAPPAPGYP